MTGNITNMAWVGHEKLVKHLAYGQKAHFLGITEENSTPIASIVPSTFGNAYNDFSKLMDTVPSASVVSALAILTL